MKRRPVGRPRAYLWERLRIGGRVRVEAKTDLEVRLVRDRLMASANHYRATRNKSFKVKTKRTATGIVAERVR